MQQLQPIHRLVHFCVIFEIHFGTSTPELLRQSTPFTPSTTTTDSTTHAMSGDLLSASAYWPPLEVRRSAPGAADPEKRDIDEEDDAGDMFANGFPC